MVMTNGVFDLIHRGHIAYLSKARKLGHWLVVALNSDASARRLNKGCGRPINSLEDRMAVVAELSCVDEVACFDEDTPLALIEKRRPDVLVKGGDWTVDRIVGAKETLARGGKVYSIPLLNGYSDTEIFKKIKATDG